MWTQTVDRQWIDAVCHELSRVTGWPTTFAPARSQCDPSTLATIRDDLFSWRNDLTDGDRGVGTLGVVCPAGRELDDSFLRACEFADLVAQLMQRIFVEQSAVADLRITASTPAHPPATEDSQETAPWLLAVNRALDVTLRLADLRAAALLTVDPQDDCLRLRAVRSRDQQWDLSLLRPLCDAPFDRQSLRHQPLVIRRQDRQLAKWLPESMSLGVCFGIPTHESLGGVLWVFDRRNRRLKPRERQVIDSIVARLSDLIERAVLVEETALQRKLRSELRIASQAQTARSQSSDCLGGWCRVTSRLETYREVGGDLCEVIPLDEDRLLLAIGDAAGHSVPAAMIMATVRGALKVIAEESKTAETLPEQIIARLNRLLHDVVESYQFMTLACGVIDRNRQTLRLANAGHPPALLLRRGEVSKLEQSGLLLGVVPEAVYESRVVNLEPSDLLVFYTDGVTEARDKDDQLFRTGGITDVLRRHADQPPEEIVSQVWTALQTHLTPNNPDDRTLLVVRIGEQGRESIERRGVVEAGSVASEM